MHNNVLNKNKHHISMMFDSISQSYDFLNCLLSFGFDKIWRKKLINEIKNFQIEKFLDVATGTGDILVLGAKYLNVKELYGIDISEKMLEKARKKIANINSKIKCTLINGDVEKMQFDNDFFDIITIAYGVRNFEDFNKSLHECYRVLRKGGIIAILEFGLPKNKIIYFFYYIYFTKILPFLGFVFSKNKNAYKYLPESVLKFPYGKSFVEILQQVGFKNCYYKNLLNGISFLYIGFKY